MSRGLVNNMLTMNNLGDGSTLSLDFTTMGGALDPRLTFSRASTATFVNSSGYVEWAGANLLRNSGWLDSNPTPTNWTLSGNAATIPATGFRTFTTTTAATSFITDSGISLSQGITYSAVIEVSAVSGSPTMINTMVATASPTNQQWYQDGTLVTSGTVITSGTITYVFTAGSGSFVRCGLGTTGSTVTSQSVTLTKPRVVPGVSINATYYESTTSAAYQAPRFDYSPTNIGESRGLLVEGSSINKIYGSESLASSGMPINWSYAGNVTRNSTLVTSPRGSDDAVVVNETVTSGLHRVSQSSFSGYTVGAVCTFSCWAKVAKSATPRKLFVNLAGLLNSQGLFDLTATGTSGTAQATGGTAVNKATSWIKYPGDWYRVTVTGNFVAESSQFLQMNRASSTTCADDSFIGETDNGIIIWGCQLEAGSGASSYIVTGASQVTRNADHCTIPTASFIPGNPYPQTLFVDCIPNTPSGAFLDIVRVFDRTVGGSYAYGTEIYYYNASTMIAYRKIGASTNTERTFVSGLAYGTRHKFALSIDASSFSGSYDGVTSLGVATAPTALATVATHLGIGCTGDASPGAVMFGTIRQIKFYPTALSQSAINTLTTL
jgi:hypothetical protein